MKLIKKLFLGFMERSGQVVAAGETDEGNVRANNEDFILVAAERGLYILADGMGGHNAGEVASSEAVAAVDELLSAEQLDEIADDFELMGKRMKAALVGAHRRILEKADQNRAYCGMGCALVVAFVRGDRVGVAHVGDCRAYLCSARGARLLTKDHSSVMLLVDAGHLTMAEARNSALKNEITQALGVSREIDPDFRDLVMKRGERLLLCSDGLWDMLSDHKINDLATQRKPVSAICRDLVIAANTAGGHDNISVIVVKRGKS